MGKCSLVKMKKPVLYIIGLISTCFGVAVILKTDWGLDAWNGVFAGLEMITPFSIGIWSIVIQSCFWLTASVMNKKTDWLCAIPILFKGIFLDLSKTAISFVNAPNNLISDSVYYFIGYFLIAIGTGIYVATGYPKMPIDGLMMALSVFFSWSIKKARLLIELCGFILLLLVHGPLGIGTIIATFTIGYVVSTAHNLARKWLFNQKT
ncbi:MAG: DUF6198 family protein [Muricomes sp.]|uniref:YczE/YyaS/YitT family protein n=1 Tax=Faecalicatena contorta TaxID=39482 RepID=UPI002EA984A1|nr:DUF6198 family protein [Muricomes sp.]